MTCFYPLTAWRSKERGPSGKRLLVFRKEKAAPAFAEMSIKINCGRCSGCRLDLSRQWAIRCTHEASLYPENTFSTLTYRNDNLPNDPELGQPEGGTLVLRDLQLFLKKLRKKFGTKIRFYACGEYGGSTSPFPIKDFLRQQTAFLSTRPLSSMKSGEMGSRSQATSPINPRPMSPGIS